MGVGYYKSSDKVTAIHITKLNIMFEWDESDDNKEWRWAFLHRFFKEKTYKTQQTHKIYAAINASNNGRVAKEEYTQDVEAKVMEHNYADTVTIMIDSFEHSYSVYEAAKHYLVNHQGFQVKTDYLPNNYAVFVKRQGYE